MGDADGEEQKRQVNPAARHDRPMGPGKSAEADAAADADSTDEAPEEGVRPVQGARLDPHRQGGIGE